MKGCGLKMNRKTSKLEDRFTALKESRFEISSKAKTLIFVSNALLYLDKKVWKATLSNELEEARELLKLVKQHITLLETTINNL